MSKRKPTQELVPESTLPPDWAKVIKESALLPLQAGEVTRRMIAAEIGSSENVAKALLDKLIADSRATQAERIHDGRRVWAYRLKA